MVKKRTFGRVCSAALLCVLMLAVAVGFAGCGGNKDGGGARSNDYELLTDEKWGGEVIVRFDYFGGCGVFSRDFAQGFEWANRMYGAGAVRDDEHIAFFHFFDV